jgi:tetratricopeptide (TPR) repeat protein
MVDSGGLWTPPEDELGEALQTAQVLIEEGRADEAGPYQQRVIELARERAEGHPNHYEAKHLMAATQYELAGSLNASGRHEEALAALHEAQLGYTELQDAGVLDATSFLADVRARRAMTQAHRGHGATAVLEMDGAVIAYGQLVGGEEGLKHQPDFARVLAMNALILRRYGDPALAVASADAATQLFLQLADQINESPQSLSYARYLCTATAVSADVHAAEGRLDLALEADEIGLTTADTLADSDSVTDMRTLVAALTRKGKHLGIIGRMMESESCLRTATDTDPETAARVIEELDRGLPLTLVSALENAELKLGPFEQYYRLLALSEPAPGMTLATVSGRTDPESAAVRATELAELVKPLLLQDADTDAALTLGLEAHYLFAISSERESHRMRYETSTYVPIWAQLLLDVSEAYYQAGRTEIALDLGGWCAEVATALIPFTDDNEVMKDLAGACYRHHGNLLAATGDLAASHHAHEAAQQLQLGS